MIRKLGLVGCGLMGGSLALALKAAGCVTHVVGYSPSESSIQTALALGAIDSTAASCHAAAECADVVVMAVPVNATAQVLDAIAPVLQHDCLLMDMGSTKQAVIHMAQAALGEKMASFVPSHPIAGKEKAGVAHAQATLFQDRTVILTPAEHTSQVRLSQAHQLWEAVGARVQTMSAAEHDHTFAAVSHLPHLLAFGFINGLRSQPDGASLMAMGGPGFKDFSRIAASDPQVWLDIFQTNQADVLAQCAHFQQALNTLTDALKSGDAQQLKALIAHASLTRQEWSSVPCLPEGNSPNDLNPPHV